MQSLDVYNYINQLTRSRDNDLSRQAKRTIALNKSFRGNNFNIHVFASHNECLQILNDKNFVQPKIADAISEIFDALGMEAGAIEGFLRANPIEMNGAAHSETRQSFIREYKSSTTDLMDALPNIAKATFDDFIEGKKPHISTNLVEPYVDAVVERILNGKEHFPVIMRDSWGGGSSCIFEYLHSATKIKKKNTQVFRLSLALRSKIDPCNENKVKVVVLLTHVLQGRDPLIGALTAYMNSLVSMRDDERRRSIESLGAHELFWRTSPVNYIGRIATTSATLGSILIRPRDHVIIMLPWASHDTGLSAKDSLAFGAGKHVCAGQALAIAVADAWIRRLKTDHTRLHWQEIRPDQARPAVFRQYRRRQ